MKNIIQNKLKIVNYDISIIKKLKNLSDISKNHRSRIVIHINRISKTNEMIIVLKKGSYIQPHIHPHNKTESYHVIEGKMDVFLFNKHGKIIKVVKMGNYKSGLNFYYRMNKSIYHMPIAKTKFCVYHEVYSGPFKKNIDVKYSTWSPNQKNLMQVKNYMQKLYKK